MPAGVVLASPCEPLLRIPEIHRNLEVEPELGCGAERSREEDGRLGCDGTSPGDDAVHSLDGDPHFLGERHLGDPCRLQVLLEQHLAGRCVLQLAFDCL